MKAKQVGCYDQVIGARHQASEARSFQTNRVCVGSCKAAKHTKVEQSVRVRFAGVATQLLSWLGVFSFVLSYLYLLCVSFVLKILGTVARTGRATTCTRNAIQYKHFLKCFRIRYIV